MNSEEAGVLLHLERQLMDADFRRDPERVSSLLEERFYEVGSSGRVWTRTRTLHLLDNEKSYVAPQIDNFKITVLGQDARLATYVATRPGEPTQRSLRSSIWVQRAGNWQIVFHQGTCMPETVAAET